MLTVIRNKRLAREKISSLAKAIKTSKVFSPPNVDKFVFLCGANRDAQTVSARREAIIEFSKVHLPDTLFFIAEEVFRFLQKEKHDVNILDIENLISKFADHVLIILESPSAFAELGAFSHKALREKLLIINDSKFRGQQSFINLGPIRAVKEKAGPGSVIHYEMGENGVFELDTIGDTFEQLYEILNKPIKARAEAVSLDTCCPEKDITKTSVMFIHDLVYFLGPISNKELIEVLKQIFGDNKNFNAKECLGMLGAFDSVSRISEGGLYKSKLGKPFLEYRFDINDIISTFRNYLLKYYSERLNAC